MRRWWLLAWWLFSACPQDPCVDVPCSEGRLCTVHGDDVSCDVPDAGP